MKFKAIITGVTGMVGEGVLHECLKNSDCEAILIIGRRKYEIGHQKVKQILVKEFAECENIKAELSGYDACFFCLGTTSVGKSQDEYYAMTYSLTLNFAKILSELNPQMTFCYVSGAGTDSSEKGKLAWARVKGKTENDLTKLNFKAVYNFRPGFITPNPELKNTLKAYKYLAWLIPIFKIIMPNSICSLNEIGQAMINAQQKGYTKATLEVRDIKELAKSS